MGLLSDLMDIGSALLSEADKRAAAQQMRAMRELHSQGRDEEAAEVNRKACEARLKALELRLRLATSDREKSRIQHEMMQIQRLMR